MHGGPGDAQSPLRNTYEPYEKDFTIVQWDQRGAAKTFGRNPHSPPVPDYIGTGQVGSWRANLRAQFDFMLARSRAANDRKKVELMEAIGTPNPKDAKQYFSWWSMRNPYMTSADAKWFEDLKQFAHSDPEFTEEYLKTFGEGMEYSGRTTLSSMLNTELPTTARIITVPFFVIQGKEDMATPTSVAVKYFNVVKAPRKKLIIIEHAGHFALVTHREEFLKALVKEVRPLAR